MHILLWRIQCRHSFVKQFGIRDSGHRKNARVRLPQLARPIDVVPSWCSEVCLDIALIQHSWMR